MKPALVLLALHLGLAPLCAALRHEPLPEPGLQPMVMTGTDGVHHLVYLVGNPKAANIHYRHRGPLDRAWSPSIRVNHQEGSAIAIGTIRGPQLALGRSNSVHVIWNGSDQAEPKPGNRGTPLLHARLEPGQPRFSPQQNLIQSGHELDGGGSVTASPDGTVRVVWHISPAGKSGETNRVVVLSESTDDGRTFQPQRTISPPGSGACGCCGLTAASSSGGALWVLYRSATTPADRAMRLLRSDTTATTFSTLINDAWNTPTCPMSSASILPASGGTGWAAWETAGRIRILPLKAEATPLTLGPSQGAKHPRLASSARGETVVAWTEGTGWQRGGTVAWQRLRDHRPDGDPVTCEAKLPAWSYPALFSTQDGSFVLTY